jgi:molybdopterin biosynthesis enzyme
MAVDNICLRKVRNFKFSNIKVYNVLAVAIILFGSEILTPRERIKSIDVSQNGNLQENGRLHPF